MEIYKYLGSRKRHSSKSDKDYFLAFILLENNNGFDILQTMITEKQVEAIDSAIDKAIDNDTDFDISKYLSIEYNSYNKRYDLKLTYGL